MVLTEPCTTRRILKLKRSRRDMTTMTTVPKKQVRFGEARELEAPPKQQQELLHSLWYTRDEQQQQLADAKRVIPAWRRTKDGDYDYAILLEDSYQNPHSKVQEYLQAFCAQEFTEHSTTTTTTTMRGLELSLGTAHAMERHDAKQKHRRAVLSLSLSTNPATSQELAHCSRSHSASSKLFAMRLGRADARVAAEVSSSSPPTTTTTQMADNICQEHWQREQWQQQQKEWKQKRDQQHQQLERISASIRNVANHNEQSEHNNTVALSYPSHVFWRNLQAHYNNKNNNNNHPKMSLSSLICLRNSHGKDNQPAISHSNGSTSPPNKYHAHVIMALPIQHVVYGRYSQVASSSGH